MKSKKMLAQIAAFLLVFGMTGVVSSWADNTTDEVVVKGTTVEQYDPINIVRVDNTLVGWIQLRMAACPLLAKM